MIHDRQSAQISQKQDERNRIYNIYIYIYIYVYIYIRKTKKKNSHSLYTEAVLQMSSYKELF